MSAASVIQTPAEAAREPGGDLQGELVLDDLAHRLRETAGRVEDDDRRVVVVALSPVELVVEVARRDRVDLEREVDGEHARVRGGREGQHRNGERHG